MTKTEYPSQKKYRDNNPAVTFRMKRVDKERLDIIIKATGKTLSAYMTDFVLDNFDRDEELSELANMWDACKGWAFELEAKNKELEKRLKELKVEERFTVPCSVCGTPMNFSSNKSSWLTKVQPILKQAFSKWKHTTCKTK